MAFIQAKGRVYTQYYPKAASTAIAIGDLLYANGTGEVTPATTTSDHHVGVSMVAVTASDSDYASTTLIPVSVPVDDSEWFVDVGTGSAAESIIGTFVDLAAAGTADVTASSVDALFVTGVVSASKIIVKVNDMASYRNPS